MKSQKQRAWMWANNPEMAKEFESHTPKGKKLPKYAPKKKANYDALIVRLANIEEALAKGLREEHPDWTMEQICDEIDKSGEEFAKRNASVIKLSSREFVHCPVCGENSSAVGVHGASKKYVCDTCGYKFSNK